VVLSNPVNRQTERHRWRHYLLGGGNRHSPTSTTSYGEQKFPPHTNSITFTHRSEWKWRKSVGVVKARTVPSLDQSRFTALRYNYHRESCLPP